MTTQSNLTKTRVAGAVAIIAILSLAGCGTLFTKGGNWYRQGERQFEAGSYQAAVESVLEALKENPEFEEARDLLDRAFAAGKQELEPQIAALEAAEPSLEDGTYIGIYQLYEQLNALHQAIANSTMASAYQTVDYTEQIATARETAAEAYYQAGVALLEAGDFRSAREAVRHFNTALAAVGGYADAADLRDQAEELAQAKLVIYTPAGGIDALRPAPGVDYSLETDILSRTGGAGQFTQLIDPATLGVGDDASVDEVVARAAEEGISFVLYVDGAIADPSVYGPNQSDQVEFYAETYGYELTVGYSTAFRGSFELYDAVTGERLAAETLDIAHEESATMQVYEPTTQREFTLSVLTEYDRGAGHWLTNDLTATWDVLETSSEAIRLDIYDEDSPFGKVFHEAGEVRPVDGVAITVPSVNLDELRAMNFGQMAGFLNGKAIFPGVEVVWADTTGVILLYRLAAEYPAATVEEVRAIADKATQIVDIFRTEGVAKAQAAAAGAGSIAGIVAGTIGGAVAPFIQ